VGRGRAEGTAALAVARAAPGAPGGRRGPPHQRGRRVAGLGTPRPQPVVDVGVVLRRRGRDAAAVQRCGAHHALRDSVLVRRPGAGAALLRASGPDRDLHGRRRRRHEPGVEPAHLHRARPGPGQADVRTRARGVHLHPRDVVQPAGNRVHDPGPPLRGGTHSPKGGVTGWGGGGD